MSGDGEDADLQALFLGEIRRHAATVAAPGASDDSVRRALHALKGTASLLGESALAEALARLERRHRASPRDAREAAASLLIDVEGRVARGEPPLVSSWPEPPDDLLVGHVPEGVRPTYVTEMKDRLTRIDEACASGRPADEVRREVLRHVHAMKGAAGNAGADEMAWFCHGLETELKKGEQGHEDTRASMTVLAALRGVWSELIVEPNVALARLSNRPPPERPPAPQVEPPPPRSSVPSTGKIPRGRSTRPPLLDDLDGASTRVPNDALDRLAERTTVVARAASKVAHELSSSRAASRELRQLAVELAEALRLIGPPRPWGAPAAALLKIERVERRASAIAEELERALALARDHAEDVEGATNVALVEVGKLRKTRASWLLDRIAAAISAQAPMLDKHVKVAVGGGEQEVDRSVLEALFDPVLQIAQNALAHGLELPHERTATGKPREGTLTLTAAFDSDRFRLTVEDDGAGVDVDKVRERALSSGVVPREVAEHADVDALLDLLFLPGFTTRAQADVLAGRGLGLDLAHAAVRRLGGGMRLASRTGRGVTVTVEVPAGAGALPVLWARIGARTVAFPARGVRRVLAGSAGAQRLARVAPTALDAPFSLELDTLVRAGEWLVVAVDAVLEIEEVVVRPLPPLVSSAGPFRGAVLRPDGNLDLVIDLARVGAACSGS